MTMSRIIESVKIKKVIFKPLTQFKELVYIKFKIYRKQTLTYLVFTNKSNHILKPIKKDSKMIWYSIKTRITTETI